MLTHFKKFIKTIPVLHRLVTAKNGSTTSQSIRGSNNVLINKGSFTRVTIDIEGNGNRIEIGENSRLSDTLIYVRGDNHSILFGENCYMNGGELWLEDNNCSISIARKTTIERAHLAITEPYSKLAIGEDCMLAKQVEIRTGDSHSIIEKATGKRINKAANVSIGAHVWIGAHAIVLKGVTIGNDAIIGTASVVTKDIAASSIAAGIPAVIIKSGVTWDRRRLTE